MADGIPDIVKGLTEAPSWQQADANGRRGMVRELAVAAMADGVPDEELNPFLAELYDAAGAKGAVGWTKDAVVEAAKSVPAGYMAVGAALTDAVGLTDMGSGDRVRRGKEDLTESIGQRVKSLAPGDNQEVRDRAFADFKADLETGAAPPGVDFYLQHGWMGPPQRVKKLAGGFRTLEEDPAERAAWEEGRKWLGDWSEVLLRVSEQAQDATAGEETFDFARKRGQGMFDTAMPELVADYMATRDPAVWSAIQNVGSESQTGYNIRKAQEQDLREWGLKPEQSLADDLTARALSMQSSPIDMAMTAFPLLKGAQALKAARGGRMAQALRNTAESAAGEFVSEAATEALSDSGRAGTGRILEAGAMGAVGGGVLTGGSAAAGAVMNLPGKRAAGVQSSPTVDTAQGALVEAPGKAEEAASAPAPVVPSSDVTRLPALLDPAAGTSREGGLLEALVVEDPEAVDGTDRTDRTNDFAGVPEASGPADLLQPEGGGLLVSPPPAPAPSSPYGDLEQAFRDAVGRGAVPPVPEAPAMLEPTPEMLGFAARGALRDAGVAVSPDTGGAPAPAEAQRSAPGIEVGRVEAPPVPDTLETVTEQARLAADRNSTRRAVLITPGTPRPQKTPGLKGVKTPHGLLLYNPKKVPLQEAMAAARAEVFDARILGMSDAANGTTQGTGAVGVTASTPAAPNVQAELVTDPAALPAAVAAAQAAAPGAVVEVKPAAQVLEERSAEGIDSVYPQVRNGVQKWMVQAGEKRGFGDWIFNTEAEARQEAALQSRRRLDRQAALQKQQDVQRQEDEKRTQQEQKPRAFARDRKMAKVVEERAVGVLTKSASRRSASNQKIYTGTKAAVAEQMLADGYQPVRNGNKFEFNLNDGDSIYDVSKTEFEFAEWLKDQAARLTERAAGATSGALPDYTESERQRIYAKSDAAFKALNEASDVQLRALDNVIQAARKANVQDRAAADKARESAAEDMPFSKPSDPVPGAPSVKHGESAVRILGSKAPEIVKDLRVVANVGELNPADYTPAQWQGIQESGTEGFFHPASGQSVVILDNIQPRPGESPVRAVARVILHERLGHAGLGVLRRSDAQFARRWADLVARIPAEELMAIASESGYAGIASDEQSLAEEWLARHAERVKLEPPGSPLRQLWDALVAAVRRLMSAFSPGGMTAEQLAASLLQRSRKALARQTVMPDGAVLEGPMMHSIRAYHGTPHKVDKFTTDKIGTGEGAQAYGWGLYFAESERVAKSYMKEGIGSLLLDETSERKAIREHLELAPVSMTGPPVGGQWGKLPTRTEAEQREYDSWLAEHEALKQKLGVANLYTVELLPDADEFLDWDKPLSEQSDKLKAILKQAALNLANDDSFLDRDLQALEVARTGKGRPLTGSDVYADIQEALESRDSKAASEYLSSLGIPGIRYLDGNSRDGGSGTSNYVIFDEKLVKILEENGQPVGPAQDDIRFSRAPKGPLEVRDLPEWAKRRLGLNVPAPYRVQGQAVRRILKGDALPKGWGDVLAKAGHEVDGILSHMGTLAADMQRAMKSYAKASGQALEQVERAVQIALTGDRLRILPAGAVRESALAVRSFLDGLSAQVAAITGGDLGKAILDNRGHWMRRSYLAFDEDADWNYDTLKAAADKGKALHGRDAKAILARAEKFLQAQNPTATPAALEALMRDLTDRNALADVMAGTGPRVTKEVTSLMRRRTIPKALRDLMGEVRDPFANAVGSVKFQAQFIARHDQQQTLARIGLASGLISHKREGVYKEQLGDGTQRWSGFYAKTASGKTVPLYTTPELMQAMQSSPAMGAQDVGHAFLRGIQALNGIAKANKVALNPDSMAPQYFGNVVSLIMGGDLLWLDGWKNMAEAVRIYRSGRAQDVAALKPVEKALLDSRRQMLARMTAAGVVNSASLDDLRATLDTAMLKFSEAATAWDRTAGFAHGALLGQSFGRTFGAGGRLIGAAAGAAGGAVVGEQAIQRAFHKIAQWAVGHPDRVGKMTSFLTNLEHELAAGTPDAAAVAAGKTLDTLPAYEKIPQLLRNMSKYSMLGSFMAFKYETLRNAYHNVRLGVQEIKAKKTRTISTTTASGTVSLTVSEPNWPLVRRGVRRLAGTAAVASLLGWGIPALGGLIGKGLGDDEDKAYRQWLGAPWERDALLTFTHFDGEKASFFNSGYLIPQGMIVEWARSAQEDGFDGLMGKAWQDFAEGSVVLDPLLDALRNSKKDAPERPVSYKDGYAGFLERLDYAVQRILEPGAADKLMRVRRAVMDEPTAGRSFSTQEEMLRLAGFRSYTYDHQPRIASTLYRLNEEKQKITAEARTRWKSNRPGERATAVPDANARMEALDAEAAEFTRAMKLLKLPAETRTPDGDRLRFKPGVRLRDSEKGPVVR